MSNNYYQLYIENTLQLAETLVVKSTETAEALNRWVTDSYGLAAVDTTDPTTWKYYLNICGEYHPTDAQMTVVSLDTLETIVFSKDNLLTHRATARGYGYGSREYRALVAQYPTQEMLILGILYPADMASAVAADNFTILSYPSALVEVNEYSLIANLQQWINSYRLRWVNMQYAVCDDLYTATALGVLYLNLVPTLLNLRLAACKTQEAHSYHVRQYLASHGLLDVYLDSLTLKQALWLYRNIAYIERNNGQRNIFEWLVEHIMTERNLPLAEYVMRHDLSNQPAQIYPSIVFQKNSINPPQSNVVKKVADLSTVLTKEDPLAVGNVEEHADHQADIQSRFENSPSNVVLTKVLESAMIDYSNATPYTLEETLVNHWLWLSSNGYYYQAVVAITNPRTGERIPMEVKDAFVFMWYAFCASVGIHLSTVPQVFAKRVMRIPTPSVDQLMAVADASVLPRSFAQQVHDWMPVLRPMISTEAFYSAGAAIYEAANWQRYAVANVEHATRRGYAQGVVAQLYSDNVCDIAAAGMTYDQWFSDRKIAIADFSPDDLGVAWQSITQDATGLSLHTTPSLRNLQKAMVSLLGQLSSYSVQFLTDINATDIKVGDLAAIRVGQVTGSSSEYERMTSLVVEPLEVRAKGQVQAQLEFTKLLVGANNGARGSDRGVMEVDAEVHTPSGPGVIVHFRMDAAPLYLHCDTPEVPSQEGVVPVPGVEVIYGLTAQQREGLRDVYRTNWGNGQTSMNLEQVLSAAPLPGFDWTAPNLGPVLSVNQLPGFNSTEIPGLPI